MPCAFPNLFILSSIGDILVEKHWIGHERRLVCDLFMEECKRYPVRGDVPPLIQTAKHVYLSIQRQNITFLSVTTRDCSPLFILEFLHLIVDVFCDYFGSSLSESLLRENFALVYQLLDEMVDGGFGYTTELNQLKDMILPPSLARKFLHTVTGDSSVSNSLPQHAISKIPWRKMDVKYVTNEIYFDLLESIDCIIGANQQVIHSNIYGEMRCNCRLSGMPDLTLSFAANNILDDISLHRCVRINRYQREKVISFVPPDGQFKLLSYKMSENIPLPLYVKPLINYRAGQGRVHVMVGSKLTGANDKPITGVVIYVPLPHSYKSHTLTANVGSVRIDQEAAGPVARWDIGRLPKEVTPQLEGAVILNEEKAPDEAPTLRAEFQVKMLASSGLKVDGLAIRGVNYKPFKGVRSITQAGRFQIRCVD